MKQGEGSYVEMDGIHEIHSTHVSFHLDRLTPAHTDGELLPEWGQDFEYKIFPKRLHVLVP